MVKKLLCALLAALLLLACAIPAFAAPAVVDDAGLFRPAQTAEMELLIDTLRTRFQVDAVVLTTTDTPITSSDSRLVDWADRYYEDHGYGIGEDRAGIIYMIDMNNRYSYLSTAGVMIDYLTDSRIENCLDDAQQYLRSGDYGQAAIALLKRVTRYMEQGVEEGSFRYDEATGQRLSGLYNWLTPAEIVLSLAAGLLAAGAVIGITSAAYNLHGSTYKYDLAANGSIRFSRDESQFLRQHVSRVRNDSSSGGSRGGSGVHRSSGGMHHGGGGRHF